jgi:hydrogenase-1 operon protein HyaF
VNTHIKNIPVFVEQGERADFRMALSAQVKALLQELQQMLQALIERSERNVIDIRSLPMLPGERDQLKDLLGSGEVQATLNALGPTAINETQIPGVWWITHKNVHDEIVGEFIEVTTLPEILVTQQQDLQDSVAVLQRRLEEYQ